MNKTTKILVVLAGLLFVVSPAIAERTQNEQLFLLGNADRTYQEGRITCYLGQLFPGQPIYFCMTSDGGMDKSFFVYQTPEMNKYYTGSATETLSGV